MRTYFVYSDEGLIGEYDSSGLQIRLYGYKPGSTWTTDPLFMKVGTQYYFYQNDHLGTPQKMMGVNGAVVWSAKYSSFGKATVDPSSSITNNLRFPGQYFDSETVLHYNLNRYYNPGLGRYYRADPIHSMQPNKINIDILAPYPLKATLEMHRYLYATNNPIGNVDTKGLYTEVGVRQFYPHKVPYARHCFVRFNGNNMDTLSYDNQGVHGDPNPGDAPYSKTTGCQSQSTDDCVRKEMQKCKGEDYDFIHFNCCMCVSNALNACGLKKDGLWPNLPADASNPPYFPPDFRIYM